MLKASDLFQKIKLYESSVNEDLLKQAYDFSMEAHSNQIRASGAPYFSHPLEVASILIDLKLDSSSIMTALLHDTVEDTGATLKQIQQIFGAEIARLVDGVTKLSRLELKSEATKQAENFQKLVLAMSSDIRVLLVKLADRLHNMRTLHDIVDQSKKHHIARETLEIYAPLSERMGMHAFKDELENIAFSTLYPELYESITARLNFLYQTSENSIEVILEDIKKALLDSNIPNTVSGRCKTPYSIWKKMQKKSINFEQLSDIMAFRVIVDTSAECYQVLGIMHSHYLVIPGRFKDYISTPKSNKYQSLHTGLMGPLNQRIEVQIRTHEMNKICELGVAAHWQYKKGGSLHDGKQYAWLRSLLEILEHASGPEEFLEYTKLEMFHDQVFCFTPKGELISLPKGSTPIDFAYDIHSEVGDRTVGSKINGRQMPLRTILQNGDQVEIVTNQHQCPSPTWERFVVTGKARARIRRFIRFQQREQFKDLGKTLLQKACLKEGVTFLEKNFMQAVHHFQYPLMDDLLAAIGEGIHTTKEAIQVAYPNRQKKSRQEEDLNKDIKFHGKIQPKKLQSFTLEGLIPGMVVHFAKCCHALPGDKIRGIVVTGKGITVHTDDCESLNNLDSNQLLDLGWPVDSYKNNLHVGRLKITFLNKKDSLAVMTTTITKANGNITNLKIVSRTSEFWDLMVDVEVTDLDHLLYIKAILCSLPIILSVDRI